MQASDIISLVGLGIAGLTVVFSYLQNNKLLKENIKKEERDELIKVLDEFYGPYQQLLETSKQLSDKLRSGKPENWRTLVFLLEGNTLEGNDKFLFDEIMLVTDQLEELRVEHGRLVDDQILRVLLAKANVHFRILKSAYGKNITHEIERFSDYVYPRELNGIIDAKILEIQNRIKTLK
jgi:hypothetical protein